MKIRICLLLCATLASCVLFGENDYVEKNGGLFKLRGKGYVGVADCRPTPCLDDLKDGVEATKSATEIDVRTSIQKQFSIASAQSLLAASGANVAVFVVDDPTLPMALTAREEKWAVVNAAKLCVDNPATKKFRRRLAVLIVRECCRVLGADEFNSKEVAFGIIRSVADIDAINSLDVTLNATTSMDETMPKLGIEKIEIGTYFDACELGIAPAPTNAIQKTVWEKVHAIPDKPMTIEYDPKKDK